jgi:hypothetical protein
MSALDRVVTESLWGANPRAGFEAELQASIADAAKRPFLIDRDPGSPRWGWIVVGTVAGVASASGAALWGVRRRQRHRGVA